MGRWTGGQRVNGSPFSTKYQGIEVLTKISKPLVDSSLAIHILFLCQGR